MKYVVVSTYYKHAEYDLQIFQNEEELRDFLEKELRSYEEYFRPVDTNNMTLFELIRKTVDLGNIIVEEERGWGVREIRLI
jgi:hypothetical protein